jgi:hypothetical protein
MSSAWRLTPTFRRTELNWVRTVVICTPDCAAISCIVFPAKSAAVSRLSAGDNPKNSVRSLSEGVRASGSATKLGMQPGRIAERISQLSKRRGCRRHYRCLIDSPMSAEDDCAGGAIEEPGPYNVANTGLDGIIIIPLIAPKDSLGQTFGKLNPTPARGGLEH